MRNLTTIENRVLAVLKEHTEARNDDMKLYLLISKACIYAVSYTHQMCIRDRSTTSISATLKFNIPF